MEFEVVRFNELKKYIGTISFKTLSVTLKELESDQSCPPGGISADTAEGRIQFDRTGQKPDTDIGQPLRMGR